MTQGTKIGRNVPRLEGPSKVSGAAVYASDLELPRMLHEDFLGSSLPYARIKRIDTSEAVKLSGVKVVITGEDVNGLFGSIIKDRPIIIHCRIFDKIMFTPSIGMQE
ncbi:MAG: hypothetical protein AAGU27_21035 [Dehalobacterium sp.]